MRRWTWFALATHVFTHLPETSPQETTDPPTTSPANLANPSKPRFTLLPGAAEPAKTGKNTRAATPTTTAQDRVWKTRRTEDDKDAPPTNQPTLASYQQPSGPKDPATPKPTVLQGSTNLATGLKKDDAPTANLTNPLIPKSIKLPSSPKTATGEASTPKTTTPGKTTVTTTVADARKPKKIESSINLATGENEEPPKGKMSRITMFIGDVLLAAPVMDMFLAAPEEQVQSTSTTQGSSAEDVRKNNTEGTTPSTPVTDAPVNTSLTTTSLSTPTTAGNEDATPTTTSVPLNQTTLAQSLTLSTKAIVLEKINETETRQSTSTTQGSSTEDVRKNNTKGTTPSTLVTDAPVTTSLTTTNLPTTTTTKTEEKQEATPTKTSVPLNQTTATTIPRQSPTLSTEAIVLEKINETEIAFGTGKEDQTKTRKTTKEKSRRPHADCAHLIRAWFQNKWFDNINQLLNEHSLVTAMNNGTEHRIKSHYEDVLNSSYVNAIAKEALLHARVLQELVKQSEIQCSATHETKIWCMEVNMTSLVKWNGTYELPMQSRFVACQAVFDWIYAIMDGQVGGLAATEEGVRLLKGMDQLPKHDCKLIYRYEAEMNHNIPVFPKQVLVRTHLLVAKDVSVSARPMAGSEVCGRPSSFLFDFLPWVAAVPKLLLACTAVALIPAMVILATLSSGQAMVKERLRGVRNWVGEMDRDGLQSRGLADAWHTTLVRWTAHAVPKDARPALLAEIETDFREAGLELERYPAITADDLYYYNFWDWPNALPLPPPNERWRTINLSNWFHAATLFKAQLFRYKIADNDQGYETFYLLKDMEFKESHMSTSTQKHRHESSDFSSLHLGSIPGPPKPQKAVIVAVKAPSGEVGRSGDKDANTMPPSSWSVYKASEAEWGGGRRSGPAAWTVSHANEDVDTPGADGPIISDPGAPTAPTPPSSTIIPPTPYAPGP